MERDLNCLNKWLLGNKLSLNVVKTQAMVIHVGCQPNLKKIAENKLGFISCIFFVCFILWKLLSWNHSLRIGSYMRGYNQYLNL